jgi:hypothetical protein
MIQMHDEAAPGAMRPRIARLLEAALDRGTLLRELTLLSAEPGFQECADLWGPALYERDSNFFERFLLRHLSVREAPVIQALLPRIEADGNDELFHSLYARVTRPEAWNADLLALAGSPEPDERVLSALARRRLTGYWFRLDGDTALAIYRRNPALFGDFVAGSVNAEVQSSAEAYSELLEEASRHGDENFYWRLFRQVAGPDEWVRAVRQLLVSTVPPDAILGELRRRHPEYVHDLDAAVLAELVEKYGGVVLPYIEENADWISRKGAAHLLAAAERLGDEALYWRIFFRVGNARQWNESLLELAKQPLAAGDWAVALRLRTPPADATGRWTLAPETALALYHRDAALARPMIEQWTRDVSVPLFEAAEQAGDEDLLDLLTTHVVWNLGWRVVYDAYPTESERRYKKVKASALAELEQWGQTITERLDRLYAASPASYVTAATRILSRLDQTDGWSFQRNLDRNPVFTYLYRRHHAAWLAAPAAVRELLETLNPLAEGIALEILGETGPAAADCTVENLPLLRAALLGDGGVSVKKRVLHALELAARQSPAHAAAILPALFETMHFHARHAIADRAMVSYVRLNSRPALPTGASPSPAGSTAEP